MRSEQNRLKSKQTNEKNSYEVNFRKSKCRVLVLRLRKACLQSQSVGCRIGLLSMWIIARVLQDRSSEVGFNSFESYWSQSILFILFILFRFEIPWYSHTSSERPGATRGSIGKLILQSKENSANTEAAWISAWSSQGRSWKALRHSRASRLDGEMKNISNTQLNWGEYLKISFRLIIWYLGWFHRGISSVLLLRNVPNKKLK